MDLLRTLMQQVYELNKPMEVFRLINFALHSAYKKAHHVGSIDGSAGFPGRFLLTSGTGLKGFVI